MRRCLFAVALLICTSFGFAAENAPPNFVVVIADDVSADDLGCYGHPRIRTPHLDRLAKDGLKFTAALLTTSSCSPSRCSLLTGRYPHSTGAPELHMPLPREQVLVSSLLRQAGYHTAVAGKWHLGDAVKGQFDSILGGSPSGAERWLDVLRDRPKDRPFFLWLAALDAHRPYQAKIIAKPHTAEDVVVPPFLPDNAETRADLAQYYDEISRLDANVGKVLEELERQKIADNTVVIFLADNGRPFPRCKTTLYDSGIRTPFLVRWPAKIRAGGICERLISAVDLAPTLLDLAGQKPAKSFQGQSFAGLVRDPKGQGRSEVFAEHNWHDYTAFERAVRTERHLYIRNWLPDYPATPPADAVRSPTFQAMVRLEAVRKLPAEQRGCFTHPRPREELYDVKADPHSLKNLAGDDRHEATLKELRARLDAWIKQTADSVPAKHTPDRFDRTTGEPKKKGD